MELPRDARPMANPRRFLNHLAAMVWASMGPARENAIEKNTAYMAIICHILVARDNRNSPAAKASRPVTPTQRMDNLSMARPPKGLMTPANSWVMARVIMASPLSTPKSSIQARTKNVKLEKMMPMVMATTKMDRPRAFQPKNQLPKRRWAGGLVAEVMENPFN